MILCACGLSPFAMWYCLASLIDISLASDPLPANTVAVSEPGASSAILAERLTVTSTTLATVPA